jgi:hypothetical protein
MAGSVAMSDRYSSLMVFGAQLGTFFGGVRVAGRFGAMMSDTSVRTSGLKGLPDGYVIDSPDEPSLLFGGTVGYAVASSAGFAFSPGVLLLRTDVGSLGTGLGVNLPFEWVSRAAMRIGFEVAVGVGVGGSVRATCTSRSFSSTTSTPPCDAGEVRDFGRHSAAGFYAGFQIGWGMTSPGPLPESSPSTVSR